VASSFRARSLTPPAPREADALDSDADLGSAVVYEVAVFEPGTVPTRPVPIGRGEFQRTLEQFAHDIRQEAPPQETARELLEAKLELEGNWLVEVYRDRVLTLVPEDAGLLAPEEEQALREEYLGHCESRGGGDCLGLFTDGPYLRTDDRRTLALALSLGPVLEESRTALARELDYQAVMASLVWAVGLYCAMWLVPEPTTKGAAAVVSALLVAWLGVDTVWKLMDGWAKLATRAHEARTFAELRQAGEEYAKVLGTEAARALILAVATLTRRTLGEVAAKVRTLPGHSFAATQWETQGGAAVLGRVQAVEMAVAQERALATAVATVETVVATPHGAIAVAMLKKRTGGSGAAASGGGPSVQIAVRHRAGNRQVLLSNGQRWHLPFGASPSIIPTRDQVGDRLQEAVTRAAQEWGPHRLTPNEKAAIDKALKKGEYWLARLLEREARGRFVHDRMERQFRGVLQWNRQGVDAVDLKTGRKYEILSGTQSNLARHGRRMADEFFRMLTF